MLRRKRSIEDGKKRKENRDAGAARGRTSDVDGAPRAAHIPAVTSRLISAARRGSPMCWYYVEELGDTCAAVDGRACVWRLRERESVRFGGYVDG